MENREMFDEINALVGAVSKALAMSEIEVMTAIEQGRLGMEMAKDEQGRNYVAVSCDDRSAHIYQGAIFRPDAPAPDDRPDDPARECGESGRGCGR